MELFRSRVQEEMDPDEVTGELIGSALSSDGLRRYFELRMPDGSTRSYALPTRALGVMFTSQGVVELVSDENH